MHGRKNFCCVKEYVCKTQVKIVVAIITIHNFIKRLLKQMLVAKIDVDFHRYEDEEIDLDHDDYYRSNYRIVKSY